MMSPVLLGGIPYIGGGFAFFGKYLNVGGWVILSNLPIFFALCVASSLTGNKQAGPVIIAGLFFLMLHKLSGELSVWYFGTFKGIDTIKTAMDLVNPVANPEYVDIFQMVLGMPTFRVGIVGAIVVGVLSAQIWEKYKTFDKLPMALDFFNGQRFCVIVTFFYAFAFAAVLLVVWPLVGVGLDSVSAWAAQNGDYYASFFKTLFEVILRPIGMHHVTNSVWEYTPVGGEFYSQSKDMSVIGLHQMCPARMDEIIHNFNTGNLAMAQTLLDELKCVK
ncbi:PTS system glucose-specific IIB component and IIC component [Vibrio ponticus]|nr:PTS system glucose-specific IIB component and IIC component [Vibrio ponticus]